MSDISQGSWAAQRALIEAGRLFHQRGWVPASGGNFSARLEDGTLLITASGCHKGELQQGDFLVVDADGSPTAPTQRKPSYETALHTQIYRRDPAAGCVLHTHSVAGTILSRKGEDIRMSGYELLKVLPGVRSHDVEVVVPVVGNDQDVPALAGRIDQMMEKNPFSGAYLIAGHGLYAWGESVASARWRIEALEFLFDCELRSPSLIRR